MKCSDAARILNAVQLGGGDSLNPAVSAADVSSLDALVAGGHVEQHGRGAVPDDSLARLKASLSGLRSEYDVGQMARADYEARERKLRAEILDLSEKQAVSTGGIELAGRRYTLTYKGRSLLGAIAARLGRVDNLDLGEFERQMEGLKAALDDRASRAYEISRILRSDLPSMNAVSLRNAAVGLAARKERPKELAAAYQSALANLLGNRPLHDEGLRALPAKRVGLLAEVLVVGAPALDNSTIASQAVEMVRLYDRVSSNFPDATPYEGGNEDLAEAAAMLLTLPADRRQATLEGAIAFRGAIQDAGGATSQSVASWVLLACTGLAFREGAGDWVMRMRDQILSRGCPRAEAEMATSVLGASRGEAGDELLFQFDTARAYLTRLSEDSFVVPAAMLAAIPTSISETLDDLRLASAAASAHSLSEGGTENLSLGVKLLMQTALIGPTAREMYSVGPAPPEALSPLGLVGLALILPTALVAVYAFHEVTLHQAAVNAYTFHPVHTHYIYG